MTYFGRVLLALRYLGPVLVKLDQCYRKVHLTYKNIGVEWCYTLSWISYSSLYYVFKETACKRCVGNITFV